MPNKNVGSVTIEINSDSSGLEDGVQKTEKELTGLDKSVNTLNSSLLKFSLAAAGIYAVGKAFGFVATQVAAFTSTAAQFEQYETTLKSITGSSEQAAQSMEWITDFTAKTPYQLAQVTDSFIKLKAYGLDPLDGTLETLGDAASAMGKPLVQAVEAMADAVMGENERLKEFGIKASKTGEQIAYSWTDSSNKARNIVIKNNSEIIQSTLNAIFNEKYVGAMKDQSNTWNGMMSNMADKWTLFQKDVMSQGIFDYFKVLAGAISNGMSDAFESAGKSAEGFAQAMINMAKDGVSAIGFVVKAVNSLITLLRMAVKGYEQLGNLAGLAGGKVQEWSGAFLKAGADWGVFSDQIGKTGKEMEAVGIKTAEARKVNIQITELETNAIVAQHDAVSAGINAIVATSSAYEKQKDVVEDVNTAKAQAKQLLLDIGAGFGQSAKAADKAGKKIVKTAKKTAKDSSKAISDEQTKLVRRGMDLVDDTERAAKEFTSSVGGSINTVMDGFLNRDFSSVFDGLASGFLDTLKYMETGYSSFTAALKSMTLSSGIGFILSGVSMLMGSGIMNDIEDAPELGESFDNSTIDNTLNAILDIDSQSLEYTQQMTGYLSIISKSFGGLENALTRTGLNVGGQGLESVFKEGSLFGSRNYEYYGSSLDLGEINLSNVGDDIEAELDTVIERTKTSWYGATKVSYQHYYNDISNVIGDYIRAVSEATYDGFKSVGEKLNLEVGLLDDITIDLPKIDVSDMSAEEAASALESAWGAQMDAIAESLFGEALHQYQLAGEGLYETAVRVSTNLDQVSYSLDLVGVSMYDAYDPITGLITRTFELSEAMIEGAGGMSEFNSAFNEYIENFYTSEEQLSMSLQDLSNSFAILGVQMPTTKEEFRSLVESIDTTTTAGAMLYGQLLALSGGFAEVADAQAESTATMLQNEMDAIEEKEKMINANTVSAKRYNDSMRAEQDERASAAAKIHAEEMKRYKEAYDMIGKAYTGQLSYLNAMEKSIYLQDRAKDEFAAGDTSSYFKTLGEQLVYDKQTSVKREDYAMDFHKYTTALENEAPDATNTDIVDEIKTTHTMIDRLISATTKASYQGAF